MAIQLISALKTLAETIRDETATDGNTANEVGQLFFDIIDRYANQSLGTFQGPITLDRYGYFTDFTLSSDTTITFSETGHEQDAAAFVLVTTTGSQSLYFEPPNGIEMYWNDTFTNGGDLASGSYLFAIFYVGGSIKINYITLSQSPVIQSAVVEDATPDQLLLTYDKTLSTIAPSIADLSVLNDYYIRVEPYQLAISGATIRLWFYDAFAFGEILSLDYDRGANPIKDTLGNNAKRLVAYPITNSIIQDITAPTLSAYQIPDANPTRIYFDSSEVITGTTFAGFTLGSGKTITGLTIAAGATTGHYFTVNTAYVNVDGNDTIAYSGTGSNIQDSNSNALASFTATTVTNNVAAVTIIVMQDDFAGTTINTAKWDLIDPADTVTISQNNQLISTTTAFSSESWANNHIESKNTFQFGSGDFAFSLDIVSASTWLARQFGFQLKSNAGSTLITMRCRDNTGNDADFYFTDSTGAAIIAPASVFAGVTPAAKTWRARVVSNTLYWEYWNGSSWTTAHSVATGGNIDTDLEAQVRFGDSTAEGPGPNTTVFDNVYITNAGYSTQYPT